MPLPSRVDPFGNLFADSSRGLFFGNRDHTSVIHSIDKVQQTRKADPQFWKDVNMLQRELGF